MSSMSEKEKDEEDCSDGDLIEKIVGGIGPWQYTIVIAAALCKVSVAWHQLAIIFLAPPQNFWCARPSGFENVSFAEWKQMNSPTDCTCCRYNFTTDDVSKPDFYKTIENFGSIPCTDWEFDSTVFKETITSQWSLVCDRQSFANIAQTLYMFGILSGSFIFGIVSDRFGRKYPLLASAVLQFFAGTTTAFCTNFYLFLLLRFVDAVATGGLMVISFVICMEVVGSKYRAAVAVLYHVPFSLGHATLPALAYFLRNWKYFQLAISLPSVLMITYFWLIPESPRWLLTVGRATEAEKILRKGIKDNHMPVSNLSKLLQKRTRKQARSPENRASFFDLFKYPNLRKKTLCISFNWIVCGICFFGLSQYIGQIGGDIFINVACSAVIQIPGVLFGAYANQKWGRRKTLMFSQSVAAVACLLIVIVGKKGGADWPSVALASTGLIGISIAFPTVYLYSGELFPTVVRNAGVGFASVCARIGSMAAPFISGLSPYGAYLPPLIFGVFPIFGCFLCFFIPETIDTVLPDTIEDGEKSGQKIAKSSICS